MIEIKICGITYSKDAFTACDAGADALGFIFYPPSPRYILPEQARKIIRALPPGICKVGIFVNQEIWSLRQIVSFCGLDLMQLHGDEGPDYCRQLPADKLLKALSPRCEEELEQASAFTVRAILIDSRSPTLYGGTGVKSDWNLAARLRVKRPLILAGGLNADNVADAVAAVRPDALDFNSGVEHRPGRKDPEKLKRAIQAARSADPDPNCRGRNIFQFRHKSD